MLRVYDLEGKGPGSPRLRGPLCGDGDGEGIVGALMGGCHVGGGGGEEIRRWGKGKEDQRGVEIQHIFLEGEFQTPVLVDEKHKR